MAKVNIATLNIQSGVAATRGWWHFIGSIWKYWIPHSNRAVMEAGNALAAEDIHIAGAVEVSEGSMRSSFDSQTRILKDSSGMDSALFTSPQRMGKFFFFEGNAILSKFTILKHTSHPIHHELFQAALEEFTLKIGTKKVSFFLAHLALTPKHRALQFEDIINIIKDRTEPVILAGDFNERIPNALDFLLERTPLRHACTQNTYPSWDPKYPLDYIFLSEHFQVLDCHTMKQKFSDHLGLVVNAELN